jgi:hypothetical protein
LKSTKPNGLPQPELAQLVRGSSVLDPALKKHWLRILPYLSDADRSRLRGILELGATSTGTLPSVSVQDTSSRRS